MRFHNANADVYVPDGTPEEQALARTTHLCIGAHQDDTEIMAYHGIAECFGRPDLWFGNVVVTNGAGSPRAGIYGSFTDEEMQRERRVEQKKAAVVGEYSIQIQLDYSSGAVKNPDEPGVVADLQSILAGCSPSVVYLHNLADKHDTHVAVTLRALAAMRSLDPARRPRKVYGCEVWRNLDWLSDNEKQVLPCSLYPNIANSLVGIFDSQVTGGKRYDLATAGRRLANATYFASHATDAETSCTFAMDLTPLVEDPNRPIMPFVFESIDRFRLDVENRIRKFS